MTTIDGKGVKERLLMMSRVDSGEWTLTSGQKGACVGTLNKYLGDDDLRKLVLGWLFAEPFRPLSSKELTPGQWYALHNWIGYSKTDDGETLVSDLFFKEHKPVLSDAIRAFMQLDAEGMKPFGLSVFDMSLTAVGSLGGELTHTFDQNQDVVYDFSAWRELRERQKNEAKEREKQILRELGYDVEDAPPVDVLGNF